MTHPATRLAQALHGTLQTAPALRTPCDSNSSSGGALDQESRAWVAIASALKWMGTLSKPLDLPGPLYSSVNESIEYMQKINKSICKLQLCASFYSLPSLDPWWPIQRTQNTSVVIGCSSHSELWPLEGPIICAAMGLFLKGILLNFHIYCYHFDLTIPF